MININNILFIDTETNPDTQEIDCVTWKLGENKGIIEEFNTKTFGQILRMWRECEGVLMYSATFDIGVLSKAWNYNGFKWKTTVKNDVKSSYWLIKLFNENYKVRKIGFARNMIIPQKRNNPTPIIDLMKLWEILIEDKDISLKSLIRRHLHKEPIPWSKDNAKTLEYRYQDVDDLKELTKIFLQKIDIIDGLKDYIADEWGDIKSPATFSKLAYQNKYSELKEWKKLNDEVMDKHDIKYGFEKAFHGGLTFAFYRGELKDTAWLDIKGAYSKAIEVLNTDKYLKFDIEKVDSFNFDEPSLLKVRSNFLFTELNNGLKPFYVNKHQINWIWNYDIIAINNLIDDYEYEVLEIYKPIPLIDVNSSLPEIWNNLKNEENKRNGKTTLYYFYKFLSNTSYGIKAQRKPYETMHTNLLIAGMITSKVHQILTTINKVLKNNGFEVRYNDTDSACFTFVPNKQGSPFDITIIDKVNEAISPFEVDYEGVFGSTTILSLKRYVSTDADHYARINIDLLNEIPQDKVRVHGKSVYDISHKTMRDYALYQEIKEDKKLNMKQLTANTERGVKRILTLKPEVSKEIRPFMFIRDVKSDKLESEFMKEWYNHIDTKLTIGKLKNDLDGFKRRFRKFRSLIHATDFFKGYINDKSLEYVNMNGDLIVWDNVENDLNSESIAKISAITQQIKQKPVHITGVLEFKCRKCGVLLNPDWNGNTPNNIRPSAYKKQNYLCNECRKISRRVQKP